MPLLSAKNQFPAWNSLTPKDFSKRLDMQARLRRLSSHTGLTTS